MLTKIVYHKITIIQQQDLKGGFMKNKEIKEYAFQKNVCLWQIAMKLKINDGNFSRKLRRELSDEEKSKIMFYIDEIAKEQESEV